MRNSRFLLTAVAIGVLGCGSSLQSIDLQSALQAGTSAATGKPVLDTNIANVDLSLAAGAASDLYHAAALSDEDVKKIGDQTSATFDRQNKIAPAVSKYTKRLAKLSSSFANEDQLKLNFKVVLSSEVNACSFPNGAIRVNSALMDMVSDEELLAVLGHEIGHIKEGHRKEKLQLAFAAAAARKGVASSNSIVGDIAASDIGGYIEGVTNAQFSQSEENEADTYGLDFLDRHHLNKQAAVSVMKKLATLGGDHTLLSSHPDPAERAERLAKKIAQGGEPAEEHLAQLDSEIKDSSTKEASLETPNNNETKSDINESSLLNIDTAGKETLSTSPLAQGTRNVSFVEPITGGWYVQIAAEISENTAREKLGELRGKGNTAELQKAIVDDTTYFRVLVGPYGNHNEASSHISELGESPLRVGTPFIKYVR